MTGIMLMGEITSSDARWHSGWRHCARRRKEVSPLAPLTTHDSSIVSFFQEHAVVFMVELPRAAPLPLVDVTEGGKTPVELPVPITGLCVPNRPLMHILMTMTTSLFLLPDACFLVLCASFRYTMLIATVLTSDLVVTSVVWMAGGGQPTRANTGQVVAPMKAEGRRSFHRPQTKGEAAWRQHLSGFVILMADSLQARACRTMSCFPFRRSGDSRSLACR